MIIRLISKLLLFIIHSWPGATNQSFFGRFRAILFQVRGAKLGKDCSVAQYTDISYPENLVMGACSGFGIRNNINCQGKIFIGSRVLIGPDVSIFTTKHLFDKKTKKFYHKGVIVMGVSVGDDVWIGANVTILPGVDIGSNTIIGAGSVVSKSVTANSVVVGNPARKIKNLY